MINVLSSFMNFCNRTNYNPNKNVKKTHFAGWVIGTKFIKMSVDRSPYKVLFFFCSYYKSFEFNIGQNINIYALPGLTVV